jgi:hypothetical protein
VVVPNLYLRDRFSAVTILSDADFLPLTGFTRGLLLDGLTPQCKDTLHLLAA